MRTAAAALACAALLPAAGALAGGVSGTVRSAAGGALPGMTVQAWGAGGMLASQTATNAPGFFIFSLSPGAYRLLAFDPNGAYATQFYDAQESFETATSVAVSDCGALSGVDFVLPAAGYASGLVRDAGGSPLSGLVAAAYNRSGTLRASTETDGAGRYRITLPPGTYRVVVFDNARRYATRMWRATTDFDEAEDVVVSAAETTTGVDFTVSPAGVLSGTVRASRGGTPLGGMAVQVFSPAGTKLANATARADGGFVVAVPPGNVKVAVFDPAQGHRSVFYPRATSFDTAAAVPVVAGQTLAGLDVALPSAETSAPVDLFVVAAASSPGLGGTYFRTDLWVLNVSSETAHLSFTFLPSGGGDNSGALPVTRELLPGAQLLVEGAVATLFGRGGGGAVRITSDAALLASSRTATPAASGGGYGLGIPAVSVAHAIVSGRLPAIRVDERYRTNVGFLNPGTAPLAVSLVLSDAAGATLATGSVALGPLGQLQASTIASYLGLPSVSAGTLRMTAPTPFLAYATVIDQVTGDATFLAAESD